MKFLNFFIDKQKQQQESKVCSISEEEVGKKYYQQFK